MTYPHFFCAAVVCLMGSVAQATDVSSESNVFRYPFYAGVSGGVWIIDLGRFSANPRQAKHSN